MSVRGEPLYAKVEAALSRAILRGQLSPGERLPTESELMGRFDVSRVTVRRAVQELRLQGLVTSRQGIGTFVAPVRIEQPLTELTGFVEDMAVAGLDASARVVSITTEPATAHLAERLAVDPGEQLTRIERVRLGGGQPISFDRTWLPADLGLEVVDADLESQPIFELLEHRHGIELAEATYRLEAVAAAPDVAEALSIDAGAPVFRVERTTFAVGGRPVDHELLHYRGDAISFVTRLARARRRRS